MKLNGNVTYTSEKYIDYNLCKVLYNLVKLKQLVSAGEAAFRSLVDYISFIHLQPT